MGSRGGGWSYYPWENELNWAATRVVVGMGGELFLNIYLDLVNSRSREVRLNEVTSALK